MPLPASRPVITDAEVRSGVPAFAALMRKLIAWEQWTFARDFLYAPAAPNAPANARTPWLKPAVSNGATHLELGNFPTSAPPSLVPASLAVRVYVELSSTSATARLTFTPSVGQVATRVVDSAAIGGGTAGWASFSVPAYPRAVIVLAIDYTAVAAGTVTLRSVCAWWVESIPGLTAPAGAFAGISAAWCAEERPYSVHALRWLHDQTARIAAGRPRIVAAAAYGQTGEVLRWKVPVSRGRTGLCVVLGYVVSGAGATLEIAYNGTLIMAQALASTGGALGYAQWTGVALPAVATADAEVEILVTGNVNGTDLSVREVSIQEDEITALPGADIVAGPGTGVPWIFPTFPAPPVATTPIAASLLAALVTGMCLLIGRDRRVLLAQSYGPTPSGGSSGWQGNIETQRRRLFFPNHGSAVISGTWSGGTSLVKLGDTTPGGGGGSVDPDDVVHPDRGAGVGSEPPDGVPHWSALVPKDDALAGVTNTTQDFRFRIMGTFSGGLTYELRAAHLATTVEVRRNLPA
jgi:hypothetical protein